jgi:CubicO group peptidase (beta-lactamase class C family)
MKKNKVITLCVLIAAALIASAIMYVNPLLSIMTGYAAKGMCSGVFVSDRNADSIKTIDLSFSPIHLVSVDVNYKDKSVDAHFLWNRSRAIYREGYGVTLIKQVDEKELLKETFPTQRKPIYDRDTIAWPKGNIITDTITSEIDKTAIDSIADALVNNRSYGGKPFSFMVTYKGIPIAEKYKTGIDKETRLLSWSMAKSITNALTGVAVKDGHLDIFAPTGIDLWKDDERKEITTNDLLQMQSGLEWNEDYGGKSDVNLMLHLHKDMAAYAINKPLAHTPGSQWYYSSGSTNIVSQILREKMGSDSLYYDLAINKLFNKIGITNALFETDASGLMVSSSYVYMTTRDFMRFGLLYLNDGVFEGERILPEGWVKYTSTPSSDSEGNYGSAFWLNRGSKYPDAPKDMFSCNGHDGQMIIIIPSKSIVITLLSFSPKSDAIDFNRVIKDIIKEIN